MKNVVKKTLAALPAKAPQARRKIIEALGAHIPDDDAQHFDDTMFRKMADAHWELAKNWDNGDPKIQVGYETVHGRRKTVIDVVSDDMAFLVDSVAAEINKNNFLIDILVHPIFYAKYGKDENLLDISDKPQEGYSRQSHIHVQIKNTLSEEASEILQRGIETAMADVCICNRDWKSMLDRLSETRKELAAAHPDHAREDMARHCAFLDYLHSNNFTLLGYREYQFFKKNGKLESKTIKGQSLGLLHDDISPAYISDTEEGLPRNLQELRFALPPVSVSKTNRLSTVHRRVPMDAIAVKTYNEKGEITGEKLFLGLFTSVTYSRSVGDVPYLREKVEEVMASSGFLPGSHNSKALRHILEKYPRDELFQIGNQELFKICGDILRLQERQRIALFMRRDPFGRYISCLVYVPRDRFGTNLRKQITKVLEEELQGVCSNFYTNMDDSVFARIMYTIDVNQKAPPQYRAEDLEEKIRDLGQTWPERLSEALSEELPDGDDEVTRLTLKYGEAFPVAYTTRYRAKQAIFDIEKIEQTLKSGALTLDLYRLDEEDEKTLRLKVYNPGRPLNLSDVLPILENMDLRAGSELPFEVKPAGADSAVWIHDFLLETPAPETAAHVKAVKTDFENAFTKVWLNELENDGLNRLVLRAGLDWRKITILRAYVRYMRQIGTPYSRVYIENALIQNSDIGGLLADMFVTMLHPEKRGDGAAFAGKINKALEKVESLDQDRIIRSMLALVEATLRTNFFQKMPDGQPKPWLSIKLDSKKIADLPEPKPYREIFVYSPRVEAVHLRADKIARGGIRWSDRHEDFRTEVLGLMKAQQVKNAVIVPMGAKGGFVVKAPIKDRAAFQREGIECYRIMIRGMLDITDNLKGEKVIPPQDVARLDGDDPYLVVAADKGTATFSDIANSISKEYGFWLDDAFASGGSAGYDHKKMGITAKGAWEGVKLHFRQLNHDIQTKPFDVVGIGDMGGDVFGNGMLLSPQIHMIGAFNHAHIFCDPTPDPVESMKERKRLFKGVMGWDQYDVKKLSKGARIYSRGEKTLVLTPEIQKRFDIAKDKVTPAELIKALLRARTDLLYFGGIGGYIKSTAQTHADVGDKTNDALRVDAPEVRARVIGEGANMAMTQLGRIEFAEHGGKVNTDFIDNSAGVDTSDHEVNIKILMTDVMTSRGSKMDVPARNALLEEMTSEIAALVLRDNYQQTQAVSLAELQARENLKLHESFIEEMEKRIGLSRALEGLPTPQAVEQRLRLGKGMTRPELCVLLAYAKIVFTQDLLATTLPDDPEMQQWAVHYFPEPLREKYAKEIGRHKLRREIVAMSIANSLVNRMGPGFAKACADKTGASAEVIAQAYLTVREIYGLRDLWTSIEKLDNKVPAEVQLQAMREISRLAEHAVLWFLTRHRRSFKIYENIEEFGPRVAKLREKLETLVTPGQKEKIGQRVEANVRNGVPKDLAARLAMLPVLSSACAIARISMEKGASLEHVAATYYRIGERFELEWLRQQARFISTESHWQEEAVAALTEDLYGCQTSLTARVHGNGGAKNGASFDAWLEKYEREVAQMDNMLGELRRAGTIDLPMLVIAEQRLRALCEL